MNKNPDRLYELLPAIYRLRDAERGEPLKALLQVITEQVDLIEDDIARLYDNWFIETCEDWVVPYIADLVGYRTIHEAGEPGDVRNERSRGHNKILIPRREVANTIRYRRRKGTLALLELLVSDVAGWPARAVEFYSLLAWTQSLNHQRLERGRTVDLRQSNALELIDSPFDQLAHTVDIRRINSRLTQGRFNIPSIGLFVWRLKTYPVTQTPAYCVEASGAHCFTFSVLGNDGPLFLKPEPESDSTHIADEINLPVPLRRRFLAENLDRLYGEGKSFFIWKGVKKGDDVVLEPIKEKITAADLSNWRYLPKKGTVAVDPVLGRMAFPANRDTPKHGVWVSYHYGFSADVGGGEYDRTLSEPAKAEIYKVKQEGQGGIYHTTLQGALNQWNQEQKPHAVIEIEDSRVYSEPLFIEFRAGQKSLQLRAVNNNRPIIRLLDWQASQADALVISGPAGSRFTLDGLMIIGRGMQLTGDLQKVTIRHSTLVPGWELDNQCRAKHPAEPSLEIFSPNVCVIIEQSILGGIQINPMPSQNEQAEENPDNADDDEEILQIRCQRIGADYRLDPIRLCISDSIVDAIDPEAEAIGAPGCPVAHAVVNISRSTIFGQVQVHAVELGENSIFNGRITVARRQQGCLRFSYVIPGSRTPQRFHCQPDWAEAAVRAQLSPGLSDAALEQALLPERQRVRPQYTSTDYGQPAYCQLAASCPEEIKCGADDESEMGVFHELFEPQRLANLRERLDEYVPAGADAGVILQN